MPDALDIIESRESGGRNIYQQLVPRSVSSASGHFQMIKPTWRRWASAVGIDTDQYPEAIDAPYELQRKAAAYGFQKEGFKPWEATKHLVGQEANYSALTENAASPGMTGGESVSPDESIAPAMPTYTNIHDLTAALKAEYPQLRQTSGYRDPEHNRRVGGAKGSQHVHDRAADFSLRGLDEATQQAIIERAIALGGRGIGYYPGSNSFHVDVRPEGTAFWGPNYSSTSLSQTPQFFQNIAAKGIPDRPIGGDTAGTSVASLPSAVDGSSPAAAEPDPVTDVLSGLEALFGSSGGAPPVLQPAAEPPPEPVRQASAPVDQTQPPGQPEQGSAATLMASILDRKRLDRSRPSGLLDYSGMFG